MKVIIIGAVAAGASAATRLRRLDENAEIILLERSGYVSYANCGLPYHVGGVIAERGALLVATPELLRKRYNIDVRIHSEAVEIDREHKILTIKRESGETYQESYDKLLIATGSAPIQMVLPGGDDPAVLSFWTIPDMDRLIARIGAGAKKAVCVGAGFIGLELAENLRHRGLEVTILELAPQVLPTVDQEMATLLASELQSLGIELELGHKAVAYQRHDETLSVMLEDGRSIDCDVVIQSVGVTPNSALARQAGLKLGSRGHIIVNSQLQTSDENIYAAGDVIEVFDPVTMQNTAIPLAGPANKQGRIAADNLTGAGKNYFGSFGAAILKVGKLHSGSIGLTERRLQLLKLDYRKIYLHPNSQASYYPGGAQLHIKLLFSPVGKILGAQIIGIKGVAKRIDVIASAMRANLTVSELATLELSYAPPFNSAKDPVNLAGMIAENLLVGRTQIIHADELAQTEEFRLDVREVAEFELGTIPGAFNLPLSVLREKWEVLDRSKPIVIFCQSGLRGYVAEQFLRAKGFQARNLSGGYLSWKQFYPPTRRPSACSAPKAPIPTVAKSCHKTLDVRALACPGPVVRLKQEMDQLIPGDSIQLLAPASFAADLASWIDSSGNQLLSLEQKCDHLSAVVVKGKAIESENPALPARNVGAIVLFSNDFDKAMAALIIACGMAAAGTKVGIFFTFWGLSVLRKNPAPHVHKNFVSRMFGFMLPKGAQKLALSKMNMAGMGSAMMKQVMADKNVTSLPELIQQARSLGVRFVACEMAMDVMGLTREELIEIDEVAGVASFVEMAKGGNSLFI